MYQVFPACLLHCEPAYKKYKLSSKLDSKPQKVGILLKKDPIEKLKCKVPPLRNIFRCFLVEDGLAEADVKRSVFYTSKAVTAEVLACGSVMEHGDSRWCQNRDICQNRAGEGESCKEVTVLTVDFRSEPGKVKINMPHCRQSGKKAQ